MWIWNGRIEPMPGESVEDAAEEAIFLAKTFRAGPKGHENRYFTMAFNDVQLKIYCDTTVDEVLKAYFEERYSDYVKARDAG